nr:ribonuclease H-like domain, reverse transcriptase, RNA-dependent DNA polymerase [Tanacetum cinerariifolium]
MVLVMKEVVSTFMHLQLMMIFQFDVDLISVVDVGSVLLMGQIDNTLFIQRQKDDILLVQVYVDDIIFGSTKKELSTKFKKLLNNKFQMSSMGDISFFLGLQVQQKSDGIFLSQEKYMADILKKFDFTTVKISTNPIEPNKALVKDAKAKDVDVDLYRSMIESLMYLTTSRLMIAKDMRCFMDKFAVKTDETVYKEYEDRMERAATTASSLDQSRTMFWTTAKVKKVNGQELTQALVDKQKVIITDESIRRDLKFDNAEDKQVEGMAKNKEIYVISSHTKKVLDLEEAKTDQAKEIANLNKRVKKLEKKRKSRPVGLRRLKKGRMHDAYMFGVDDLEGNEVIVDVREKIVEKEVSTTDPVTTAGEVVTAASVEDSAAPTTATTTDVDDELTLAKTLITIKAAKPKDKGKAKMIEPEKPLKKKDQIALNEEVARKLEAKMKDVMEEEERVAREKDEANKDVIEEWDDVHAIIDDDRRLAEQIQAQEREHLSSEERSKLLAELIESRRKYFAAKRAKEIRNKPPRIKCEGKPKENSSRKLKRCLEIVPEDDDDDVAIEATPLSSKSPTIVDYKIYRERKKSYFKIIRERFKKTKPVDEMDNLLLQTLKTMFEPHVKDIIWKYQQGAVKVNNWKLFDSCGVYYITTKTMVYYLLVKKMYPFTNSILHQLWSDVRLQVDYEVEMAYDLLRLIKRQINEGEWCVTGIDWSKAYNHVDEVNTVNDGMDSGLGIANVTPTLESLGNTFGKESDGLNLSPTGLTLLGHTPFAKLVTHEPSGKSMNLRTLITLVRNEADLAVPLKSIRATSEWLMVSS